MKQLIQHLRSGETRLETVPTPLVRPGHVLIQTRRSLVSPGTERMLVEFGRASLIAKARQQPERVRQVLDKIQTDGLLPTLEAVFRRLDQPLPLGYCNVGTVLAVGEGITDLRIGDRVASNGHHADIVCVPRHLTALIPAAVSDDAAAFTVVGSIGLQGVRLLNPTLGETVVVIGLGLIGQLTADLLRLNGCRVIGIDVNPERLDMARQRGVLTIDPTSDQVKVVMALTDQIGADGVVITASSQSDGLLTQAAQMSRKRGRLVLVGVTGLNLNRADFYEKELTFQVSCSYGPGRYDDVYEQQGRDYPVAFVRWTENRNFQTILQLLASGQLDPTPLISARVPFADFARIYDDIIQAGPASLMVYPDSPESTSTLVLHNARYAAGTATIGLIGAGNFADATLLPALKTAGANLHAIASAGGLSATRLARKFGIAECTSDYRQLLNDPAIDLCIIATRHNSHARLVLDALHADKHVFVEKPLVIHDGELAPIVQAQQESGRLVMVGFNRRFSPFVQKMKALLGGPQSGDVPMNVIVTVNAGAVPASSWVHDRIIGGGRLLGEACHFVDLITFLTGSQVASVCVNAMGLHPTETTDSATLLLRCANGSTGVVNYFANGSRAYAKERVEVYSQERTLVLDNFRKLSGYGFRGFSSLTGRQDKGHAEQMKRLVAHLRRGTSNAPFDLIPFAEIVNTTQTMLATLHSLRTTAWVDVAGIGLARQQSSEPALA